MHKTDKAMIDEDWPNSELEDVNACPYCGSKERALAYNDVHDWSFYSAPGKWSFWDCKNCEALYLNPRPTEATIGKAYAKYYTHNENADSFLQQVKVRLKNECFSQWLGTPIYPRLNLPKSLNFLLKPFKRMINMPYELRALVSHPTKGQLLDLGCGSGNKLKIAIQLGWDVTGLEIDPNAVRAAREQGLNVIEGGYRELAQFSDCFDCVICSHVLEHVHQPLELLDLLARVLKPGGLLLISLPNAKSHVRECFGPNWRGLEAPRHIAIPALRQMVALIQARGFVQVDQLDVYGATEIESHRIGQRKLSASMKDFVILKLNQMLSKPLVGKNSDFIQITARMGS